MAYSVKYHEKARDEIKNRKRLAETKAYNNKNEMAMKYPEFQLIESELAKTGYETVKAFSLPKEIAQMELQKLREKNTILREERANLLKALNLPEDYFEVRYTCSKCNDTGIYEEYDSEKGVSYGSKYCDCYLSLLKKYAVEDMVRHTPMELSSFEEFNIEHYRNSKNDKESYKRMQGVYNKCLTYAQNFDLNSVDLYFYGRTGLGKTHLSLAIANEVINKGYNVLYGSVISFLNKMEKEKFGRAEDYDTENLLIDADLLILDDLGAEFTTSYTTSALYNIINSRICRGVPTIISSNLDIEELKQRYPESITSRIIGNYSVVYFSGDDVRQKLNG